MAKKKIKMTLENPPEGFSSEAELRHTMPGDYFLDSTGNPQKTQNSNIWAVCLSPSYIFPPYLNFWGVAMDEDGDINLFFKEPSRCSGYWGRGNGVGAIPIDQAMMLCKDLKLPFIKDWNIPIKNPNYKG